MPKYSGFDPIESHNIVTSSTTTTGIEHTGRGDTVLYLPFDDDVNDDSLFNQTITNRGYNGNPITVDSSYSKFGGKSLRSWLRSSLKIDNSSSMDLNTPFTVEFFFRNSTQLNQVALYTHNEINSSYAGLLFWVAADNTLRLYASSNGSSWNIFQNPSTMATISANVWHHVAVTYDGSTYRGYYDGVRKWQHNNSTTLPTGGHSYILSRSDAGSNQAGTDHVRIDDFRITKGVALYTDSTYTVPTSALGLHNGDPVSLYLPFDSDIQDDSSYGHTVTAFGNAAISSTQAKFGGNSLFIDADGDYLTIPSNPGFKFEQQDFTIEMFIRPDDVSTTDQTSNVATILDHDQDASTAGAWFALHQNNQALVFSSNNGSNSFTSSNCLSAATWHHIAVVRMGDVMTIYCDGVAVGSASHSYNFSDSTTRELYIGKQVVGSGTRRFDGYVDDLRITKGVARYTKNFIPPNAAVGATLNGKNETNTTTDFTSLYLPFDSDLNDDSSYGHTVTASGDAAISSTQAKFGSYSLALDGTGDYLTIPSNDAFHYGNSDFTIEMFVYMSSNSSSSDPMNLISKWDDSQRSWAFELENNNRPRIRFSYDGSSKNVDTTLGTDVAPTSGQWHHLAFVRSGATLTAYLDGVAGSTTINLGTSSLASPTSSVYIGQRGSQRYFNGYIDDVRILKGYAKYTADFVPPTSAVGTSVNETVNDLTVLYLPFDSTETSSSVASDLYLPFDSDLNDDSSNASTGTASGGAAISSAQSKFGGYSLALDGTNDYVTYDNLALDDGDFTIEAFIYDTKGSNYREIVNTYHGSASGSGPSGAWLFRVYSSGGNNNRLGFAYRSGSSWGSSIVSPTNAISQNTWHHVAAVRSGDTLTLYIDGTAVVSGSVSALDNSTPAAVRVGATASTPIQFFGGYIDDLRITKGTALYTSNFTVATSALGAIHTATSFQGGFEDLARNHPVTKNNDVTLNASVKKFGTSSMYFPAATDYIEIPGGQFDFASSDFTIEGWFYDSGSGSSRNVALDYRLSGGGASGSGSETFGFFFYLKESGNGKFFIGLEDDASTLGYWPMFNSSSLAISPNTWTHYAFTREGSTFRAFKGGSLIATQTGVASAVGSSGGNAILRIGGGHDSGHGMAGYIDDLRITKGKAIYTEAFTPPSSALGTEISDSSTTVTTDTKVLSSTWTMTNDGSSPRSFIDMRSDNTWANNEHLQSSPDHRWNPSNAGGGPDTIATGGTIATPGNGYRYHVFTSPGTFALTSIDGGAPTLAVEYLIVAGGGGGGGDRAGGAGGGGLKTNEDGNPRAGSAMNLSTGSTAVVVGAGGAGADAPQTPAPYQNPAPTAIGYNGRRGLASSFGSIESRGGGGGGGPQTGNPEGPGGSGGGGGSSNGVLTGYAGNTPPATPPQGNPGGNGVHINFGGGGGGAGAAGSTIDAGNGHAVPSFSGPILAPAIPGAMATAIGPTGIYAGGGGGGAGEGRPTGAGNAGTGGGGAGGARSIPPSSYNPNSNEYGPAGAPGVDGTGGGGGGAGNFPGTNTNMRPGGDGGDGIVIIKYPY